MQTALAQNGQTLPPSEGQTSELAIFPTSGLDSNTNYSFAKVNHRNRQITSNKVMTESSMHFIESQQFGDRVVPAEIDGQMTAEGMKALIERLQSIVDRGEKADARCDSSCAQNTGARFHLPAMRIQDETQY